MTGDNLPRRRFVQSAGLGAFFGGLISGADTAPDSRLPRDRDPEKVLELMAEGNKRFAAGKPLTPRRTPKDFLPLAESQKPLAVVVGCSDSRVSPELLFDLGIGELFVLRVAGNVVSGAGPTMKGSIEYAVGELGVRLILILGHSGCGAMKAAIKHADDEDSLPGHLGSLVDLIKPAVNSTRKEKGDQLANVTTANVLRGVRRLRREHPYAEGVKKGQLMVVGGVYDLTSGRVTMLKG